MKSIQQNKILQKEKNRKITKFSFWITENYRYKKILKTK